MHSNPSAANDSLDTATGPESILAVNNRFLTTYRYSHAQNFSEEDTYSFQHATHNFPSMGGFLDPEAHERNVFRSVGTEQHQGWRGGVCPLNTASHLPTSRQMDFHNPSRFANTTTNNRPDKPKQLGVGALLGSRGLAMGGVHGTGRKEPIGPTPPAQFSTINQFSESRASQGPGADSGTFSFLNGLNVNGIAPAMETETDRQHTTMASDSEPGLSLPLYTGEAWEAFGTPAYDEPGGSKKRVVTNEPRQQRTTDDAHSGLVFVSNCDSFVQRLLRHY